MRTDYDPMRELVEEAKQQRESLSLKKLELERRKAFQAAVMRRLIFISESSLKGTSRPRSTNRSTSAERTVVIRCCTPPFRNVGDSDSQAKMLTQNGGDRGFPRGLPCLNRGGSSRNRCVASNRATTLVDPGDPLLCGSCRFSLLLFVQILPLLTDYKRQFCSNGRQRHRPHHRDHPHHLSAGEFLGDHNLLIDIDHRRVSVSARGRVVPLQGLRHALLDQRDPHAARYSPRPDPRHLVLLLSRIGGGPRCFFYCRSRLFILRKHNVMTRPSSSLLQQLSAFV